MVRPIGVLPALALVAGVSLFTLTGCPSDPYDPQTWIDKLDEPTEVEEAVTKLEELRDPVAIKPLGKVWRKHNKWPRVLRVIVTLADQKTEKGGPYWEDAIPVLVEAVEQVDIIDRRSIDDAVFAADALGRAKQPDTVKILITTATQNMPKLSPGQRVRIAAVRALGEFGNDERAVGTLIKALEADPEQQPLQIHAAAANALAETKNPKAIEPLIKAMFAISPVYQQVRTALTRLGNPVVPKLIEIFQGKHAGMNAYAKEQGFATDCDKASGPNSMCKAPGNLQFKAAGILGDLRAKDAAALMAAELKNKPLVAFYDPKTGDGPPNHNAILNALRLIGERSVAPQVLAYMQDANTDDGQRPLAIDVYSFLGNDPKAMAWMADQMKNDEQEEQIRKACGLAYARLVTQKDQLAPLQYMIDTYNRKKGEWEAKLKKAAKEEEKEEAEGWIQNYELLVNEFQQYRARADVGIKCGADVNCYKGIVTMKPEDILPMLGIAGGDKMDKALRDAYRIAAVERALFELMKLGEKARPAQDMLLEQVATTDRIVREGVLMALTQVAPKPCKACEARLAEVIELQKDQTTLDYLTADTRIVLNYFLATSAAGK